MMKKMLLVGAVLATLQGCSTFNPVGESDYDCPGMPKGVVCKTPREVYNAQDQKDNAKAGGGAPTYVIASSPNKNSLQPTPVLEQAQVMRVWIAPWIDANKDLHWPGLMFTEVHPREWHFGEDTFDGVEPPVPHLMYESKEPATSAPAKATETFVEKAKDQVSGVLPQVSAPMPKNEVPIN